jgi:hypothetical protein
MGNKRLGAALAVIIGVLVAAVGLWAWAGNTPTQAGSDGPVTSTTSEPAATRTISDSHRGGGDGPPNYKDNRGHLQPRDLAPETRTLLETKAAEVQKALDQLRATELPRAAAVEEALVALGYPADSVFAEDIKASSDERAVVFGISTSGGCVKGAMLTTQTRVEVDGLIPEWGCRTPKTH